MAVCVFAGLVPYLSIFDPDSQIWEYVLECEWWRRLDPPLCLLLSKSATWVRSLNFVYGVLFGPPISWVMASNEIPWRKRMP